MRAECPLFIPFGLKILCFMLRLMDVRRNEIERFDSQSLPMFQRITLQDEFQKKMKKFKGIKGIVPIYFLLYVNLKTKGKVLNGRLLVVI